ncbi:MAG TPA: hypothetical protein VGR93_02380 [Candidatus Acidoferrales bacterium]|nr:hypothetical protein [Candidatus Acidoferrales bacterium]
MWVEYPMAQQESSEEDCPLYNPKRYEIIRMTDALIALQELTAQLETLSSQLKCIHDPGERQALLKRFRFVLDRVDELIAHDFMLRNEDSGSADSAASG